MHNQPGKKETNQDKPIAKSDRKKEGNQEKTLQSTSEQQLRHHENNNLNLPGCSEQILQNNYDQGTLQPTSEQQLRRHGNNNLNLPGSAQTLQNYDQGDDVMRTSNNHSVYDFNSGSVVDTSTVQNNSSRTPTCNKYISPAVTSNNKFYDSSSTNGIYANATSVPPTYTKELYGSGTALVNTHIHPQLYNYRNNNDGHINYNDSENAILNNLKASQESFFQIFEEKMQLFPKTQEQYVSKKMDDMQNYYEKKMDELKTYFNTKLDNVQA
ncbi:probable serine/threonine-protein kinase clkA [Temnothorax curvispinosus]|uniref:Probable serine/threonine-protein kinase clkA n=1 Tax=Temnothorax curvispinosus TaxID=300111 RepID=A0A6J1PPB2_9HYME|nr:probable serine/threonine-protein kinase clkA [Temnothorax curvispinosus]XP_024871146.1 probable serine/threonine-protein kinase clkA [Temnothorax curvispinosus]